MLLSFAIQSPISRRHWYESSSPKTFQFLTAEFTINQRASRGDSRETGNCVPEGDERCSAGCAPVSSSRVARATKRYCTGFPVHQVVSTGVSHLQRMGDSPDIPSLGHLQALGTRYLCFAKDNIPPGRPCLFVYKIFPLQCNELKL